MGKNDGNDGVTIIVFSGDMYKFFAAFSIAIGAAAAGKETNMFFTSSQRKLHQNLPKTSPKANIL